MKPKISPIIRTKEFAELLANEISKDEKFDENEIVPGEDDWDDWPPKEPSLEEDVDIVKIKFLKPYNIRHIKDVDKWTLEETEITREHPELIEPAKEKLKRWVQAQLKDIEEYEMEYWIGKELQDRLDELDYLE